MHPTVTVVPAKVERSEFLTPLCLRHSHKKDDGKWELTSDLVYASKRAQAIITVQAGCKTDLASVPRPSLQTMIAALLICAIFEVWPLFVVMGVWMACFCLFGGREDAAAALHDNLYGSEIYPRWTCDAIFREAAGVTKASKFTRDGMWIGVRLGGWLHWR